MAQGTLLSIADNQAGATPKIITRDVRLPTIELADDIARGLVSGAQTFNVAGRANISADVETLIRETGMPATFTNLTGAQMSIVSTSASDTGTLTVNYLDGSYNAQSEQVTLTGLTPVLTVATDITALNGMYSNLNNVVGEVSASTGGIVYGLIPVNSISFDSTLIRVPAGKHLVIKTIFCGAASGAAAASVVIKLESNGHQHVHESSNNLYPLMAVVVQDGSVSIPCIPSLIIHEMQWVAFTALSDKAAIVTAGFFGWLQNNE